MSAEGPLRRRPGDAARAGWRLVHTEGSASDLERRRIVTGKGLLLVFPIVFAFAIVAWTAGVRFALPLGPLVVIVVMLWPLPYERIRVTAKRVTWRDRLFGARFRGALGKTRLVTRSAGAERALLLSDGHTEQLVAMGAPEDVDALTELLHEALSRARAPR